MARHGKKMVEFIHKIKARLYKSLLTHNPNDYSVRVVSEKSLRNTAPQRTIVKYICKSCKDLNPVNRGSDNGQTSWQCVAGNTATQRYIVFFTIGYSLFFYILK
jgi:hypothetical protein